MSNRENIEREEILDIQDPLRHLRSPDADGVLVPEQPPSILNQRTDLLIPGVNPGDPGITLKLALNAAPGCGGIAWPAGEATRLFSYRVQAFARTYHRVDPRSSAHISSNKVPFPSKIRPSLNWAVEPVSSASQQVTLVPNTSG